MPPGQPTHEVGEMPNSPKTRDNPNVPHDTLVDFFRDLTEIRAEFLVYDDGYRRRRYTYAEVGRAARGFAQKLAAVSLQKSDTVVFCGENRPELLACYWGCLIFGMIASRLEVPVVPVRFDGLDRVLHTTWHMARPGTRCVWRATATTGRELRGAGTAGGRTGAFALIAAPSLGSAVVRLPASSPRSKYHNLLTLRDVTQYGTLIALLRERMSC
jgi:hypothetical protein